MNESVKKLIRAPLRAVGLDVVKHRPRYSLGEYAFLCTLGIRTVIDAGAHEGEFAQMIMKILPEVSVISCEPLQEPYRHLETSLGGTVGFRSFNVALGDTNGTVEMHRNDYTQSSSLLAMAALHKQAFPETAHETKETVEIRQLDDVLEGINLKPEILLKIDVQGYEDKVIVGAPNLIAETKAMIVEVSFQRLYEGQPLFDHVYRLLREKGFSYQGNLYQLTNPNDSSVLQADALFLRS